MQNIALQNSSTPDTRLSRTAVGIMFFLNGAAVATWASRIPAIQERLNLDTGPLGLALLSMSVGAMIAMSLAGALSSSIGSRPVIVWTMYLSCLALILPAFATNLVFLCLSVVILGIFLSSLDVAMNAHAVAVERNHGSSIMSAFHALFSIGGIFGAATGALLAWLKIAPEPHFTGMAIFLCVLGFIGQRWLLPAEADATHAKISNTVHLETLQVMFGSKFIFAVSVILFCCFLVEGAIGDWSGVYLRKTLLTSQGFAALGYAAYSVAMCIGRLTGDIIIHKCGRLNVVRFGSLIALVGLALVVGFEVPAFSLIGFSLIGLGVSNIVPIGFTAAGRSQDVEPGKAIATVSLMGYVGLLLGPPLIGFAAQIVTLRVALGILGIMMVAMVVLSQFIKKEAEA
jgi:fucose permease